MENFERLVKEKIKDEEKAKLVIDYFYKQFDENENALMSRFQDIAEFEDILNEFIECLEKETYSFFNSVLVGSFNAKMISTLDKNFTPYDVYSYLAGLKAGDESVRSMLDAHIALKLSELDLDNE